MVVLQRRDSATERIGHAGDISEFFRRKIVKIFVERIAGINAALNSVQARQQQRGEGEVRIRC